MVDELNRERGHRWELAGPCAGGVQTGAWLVTDAENRRAVLKWRPESPPGDPSSLVPVVKRLRAAGYPTPAWLTAGVTSSGRAFTIQEFVDGRSATPLRPDTVGLLVGVLERHAGLDPDPRRARSAEVAAAAVDDSEGSLRCGVRNLGHHGAALLDHYDELLRSARGVELPEGDLVHGDFNTCNVLLEGGRVSAVIDLDDLGSGTRVIDYACLLREAYVEDYDREVRLILREAAEAVAGPAVLTVCVAAAAFFIVGFKARHRPERVASTLAGLHRLADDLAGHSG